MSMEQLRSPQRPLSWVASNTHWVTSPGGQWNVPMRFGRQSKRPVGNCGHLIGYYYPLALTWPRNAVVRGVCQMTRYTGQNKWLPTLDSVRKVMGGMTYAGDSRSPRGWRGYWPQQLGKVLGLRLDSVRRRRHRLSGRGNTGKSAVKGNEACCNAATITTSASIGPRSNRVEVRPQHRGFELHTSISGRRLGLGWLENRPRCFD